MPAHCCAWNCTNRNKPSAKTELSLRFYRFPRDPERRARWAAAVRRVDFTPNENTRICSAHFVTGKCFAVHRLLQYCKCKFLSNVLL